jgi:16S rRNA (uracil1498-N3)-methyltransferase
MRIPRVYISQILTEHSNIDCSDSVAHYLKNVLRMKTGRRIILFNGDGRDYSGVIASVDKKSLSVDIETAVFVERESPLSIHLGYCLIKTERMDWLLQKATELGVTHFYPLISEYTEVKFSLGHVAKKMEHWQRVIISACEQSGRSKIPTIEEPQLLETWMTTLTVDYKVLLHPYNAQGVSDVETLKSMALLVGPEGGFTELEVSRAHECGFHSVQLGPRIFRAETAPIVALSLYQHAAGDV